MSAPERRTFQFKRWSGRQQQVVAERVQFEAGGAVSFWTGDRLELAVKREDWNDLCEVAGSDQ